MNPADVAQRVHEGILGDLHNEAACISDTGRLFPTGCSWSACISMTC